ncbi:MAG: TonB-dependent receptor family protein [Microscillaceae bacterium]|nr:TonB-dependent receptor family protein [Microscillaceae bacterium]MDW8461469.1 outer membrane beta-barrel family protein [Cytophagales bacterium]
MNAFLKYFFIIFGLWAGTINLLLAQNPKGKSNKGRITGKVIDKTKKTPVEFATVVLRKSEDTLIVRAVNTDEQGNFTFQDVEFGTYNLRLMLVGYQSTTVKGINLSPEKPVYAFKELPMVEDTKQLQEVVIEGQREVVQATVDGLVINADAQIAQQGGTAVDLLKNAPSVNVDASGNVSLRGAAANILINGRNSGFSGFGRGGQGGLDQIQADEVESIEIFTNPSARFDAEGAGGVINIRLRRDRNLGTNANVNLGYGNRNRLMGGGRINHRTEKWNIFLGGQGRLDRRLGEGKIERTTFGNETTYLTQRQHSNIRPTFANIRLGGEYYFDEKTSLQAEARIGLRQRDNQEILENYLDDATFQLRNGTRRTNLETNDNKIFNYEITFQKEYARKRQELNVSFNQSYGWQTGTGQLWLDQFVNNYTPNNTRLNQQQTNTANYNMQAVLQADYTHPLAKDGLIETGYKGTYRALNTNFVLDRFNFLTNTYENDFNLSNRFNFYEQVHAYYLAYKGKFKKFEYSLGARTEYANMNGQVNETIHFDKTFFNFFPNARLIYTMKDLEFIRLSYAKRINRPEFGDLNPFVDISNPVNLRTGNADLNPELIHSFELGYNKVWRKYTLTPSLFYRYKENIIQRQTTIDEAGVALTQPLNVGFSHAGGIELFATAQLQEWWNVNGSFSYFYTIIQTNNPLLNSENQSWTTRLVNTFNLGNNFRLQASANYNSPVAIAQGTQLERLFTDIGLVKNFNVKTAMGKTQNGTISLNIMDIFYTLQFGATTIGTNFIQKSVIKRDTRAVMLNLRYKF